MRPRGAVACGHPETARAAALILEAGGNAFDATIAAFLMSCVVEPVLASLGGGGFMLAHTADHRDVVYDFFAHTPRNPVPQEQLDFYPIDADFGATRQEFHIGLASIATPGAIKGIFRIHAELGSLPMRELAMPAIEAAREGRELNALQAYILGVIEPILLATPEARELYYSRVHADGLITQGERFLQPDFAGFLETLVREGDDLFYQGEVAQRIVGMTRDGGQLTLQDLAEYEVILRHPVDMQYRGHRVLTNPAPSCGGTLIAFALNLLEHADVGRHEHGSQQHLLALAEIMKLTNEARFCVLAQDSNESGLEAMLDAKLLDEYRSRVAGNRRSLNGTTHISVMDAMGNVAGLTASNGEGCGHILPGTGIMLNNMLGEEDLNSAGFYRWPANRRMTSMMAPTLVISPQGRKLSLGSGGSNRLRTAILQVLVNVIDFDRWSLHEAINLPRIHFENDRLNIEPGFSPETVQALCEGFPDHSVWQQRNLFFGGVHAVFEEAGYFEGAGDERRGGVAHVVR